jgi:hypothetical protein
MGPKFMSLARQLFDELTDNPFPACSRLADVESVLAFDDPQGEPSAAFGLIFIYAATG